VHSRFTREVEWVHTEKVRLTPQSVVVGTGKKALHEGREGGYSTTKNAAQISKRLRRGSLRSKRRYIENAIKREKKNKRERVGIGSFRICLCGGDSKKRWEEGEVEGDLSHSVPMECEHVWGGETGYIEVATKYFL